MRERSSDYAAEREYRDLLAAAGLALESVTEPLAPFDYRVIEARRAA